MTRLTDLEQRVVDAANDVGGIMVDAKLSRGAALTALGIALNFVINQIPPDQRLAAAETWMQTFMANVRNSISDDDEPTTVN